MHIINKTVVQKCVACTHEANGVNDYSLVGPRCFQVTLVDNEQLVNNQAEKYDVQKDEKSY